MTTHSTKVLFTLYQSEQILRSLIGRSQKRERLLIEATAMASIMYIPGIDKSQPIRCSRVIATDAYYYFLEIETASGHVSLGFKEIDVWKAIISLSQTGDEEKAKYILNAFSPRSWEEREVIEPSPGAITPGEVQIAIDHALRFPQLLEEIRGAFNPSLAYRIGIEEMRKELKLLQETAKLNGSRRAIAAMTNRPSLRRLFASFLLLMNPREEFGEVVIPRFTRDDNSFFLSGVTVRDKRTLTANQAEFRDLKDVTEWAASMKM